MADNLTREKTTLTAKEEAYCQKYIKYLNKTKAALAAGYAKKTAAHTGWENHQKPHIIARIAQIREELKEQLGIDEHSIVAELAELSYWNIKDFVSDKNEIKDLSKMAKSRLKPVVGIKSRVTTTTEGKTTIKEVTTELKMVDKRGTLVDLGRHLGIFEKDNKQKVIKFKITRKKD